MKWSQQSYWVNINYSFIFSLFSLAARVAYSFVAQRTMIFPQPFKIIGCNCDSQKKSTFVIYFYKGGQRQKNMYWHPGWWVELEPCWTRNCRCCIHAWFMEDDVMEMEVFNRIWWKSTKDTDAFFLFILQSHFEHSCTSINTARILEESLISCCKDLPINVHIATLSSIVWMWIK